VGVAEEADESGFGEVEVCLFEKYFEGAGLESQLREAGRDACLLESLQENGVIVSRLPSKTFLL
jgi:hypothetical protein